MLQVRDTGHLNLGRNRYLLFDVLCGMPRALGNDVDVVVGDIRIGLDWKIVKRNDAPREEQKGPTEYKKAIIQGKVDDPPNHCPSRVASNWRTFETTCWPGAMPERISSLFGNTVLPP